MIAREWKCLCPTRHRDAFLLHLERTGVREARETSGYKGHLVLERLDLACHAGRSGSVEIGLTTFWESWEAVRAFAGEDMDRAVLYPGDERYEIIPDKHVRHYEVLDQHPATA